VVDCNDSSIGYIWWSLSFESRVCVEMSYMKRGNNAGMLTKECTNVMMNKAGINIFRILTIISLTLFGHE
jgi:hypothetical protein